MQLGPSDDWDKEEFGSTVEADSLSEEAERLKKELQSITESSGAAVRLIGLSLSLARKLFVHCRIVLYLPVAAREPLFWG